MISAVLILSRWLRPNQQKIYNLLGILPPAIVQSAVLNA